MKELQTIQQENKLNDVFAIGNYGTDGTCGQYAIYRHGTREIILNGNGIRKTETATLDDGDLCDIYFQCENCISQGITESDLLEIVRDRLKDFQNGPFACHANVVALNHVSAALHNLKARTKDSAKRGTKGSNAL